MMNALRQFHTKLIGTVDTTSIQARIFHEVSLIGMLAIPVCLIVNLFIGVAYVNMILIATFAVISGLYYNSRYKDNLRSSVIIFTICSNILLAINYCFNSGVAGPTLLLFLLSVVFTVAVSSRRKSLIWTLVNAVFVAGLLYLEYKNPELVRNTYPDRAGFFVDTFTSYLAVIACIIVVLSYLIKSQYLEKMKAIEASKALQEANDSKTKLLSILSHDLRSPLSSIQSYLELLVEFDLGEEERKAINVTLLKETKSTQHMLFSLLSWTKSQMDDGIQVNKISVCYHSIFEQCVDVQYAAAAEKSITINNFVDKEIAVMADLNMLTLVVRNLLNNAIKFTNTGGQISATSDRIGDYGVLTITDNGIGIKEDKIAQIFTMSSVSTYGTNNEKGVGLGLLLCKDFTEIQGGKISVVTSSGKGTSFSLHFPLAT